MMAIFCVALFSGIIAAYIFGIGLGFIINKDLYILDSVGYFKKFYKSLFVNQGDIMFPSFDGKKLSGAQKELRWAGFYFGKLESKKFLLVYAAVSLSVAIFLSIKYGVILFMAAVFFAAFIAVRSKRMKKICSEQLTDCLVMLSDALKSGYSLPQAISLIVRESRLPSKGIFFALERANNLNMPLGAALTKIQADIDTREWRMISETLIVRERVGGNLANLMQGLAAIIRQRHVLERDIKTSTSSGRLSAIIIASMAPISLALFYLFNREYISILFSSPVGVALLVTAMVLEVVGFWMIYKFTKIDHLV